MKFKDKEAVIQYIDHLPHLHPKSDLSYMKRLLSALGHPEKQVKLIHITGTNGKGSTAYFLSNLLQKAGLKTGLFVSPYVVHFNERIQLNGHGISGPALVKTANFVQKAIEGLKQKDANFNVVTFEYEVAIAFTFFAAMHCDFAVIEVGIGGTHDKTNVIQPELSIITTIGLDHEKIIGPTLADIAREKSGIIKPERPVILGNIPVRVLPILLKKAGLAKAPIYRLQKDFSISLEKQIVYQDKRQKLTFKRRPFVEAEDIAMALMAFSLLKQHLNTTIIEKAINQTRVPGRYQLLNDHPLVMLDGAHNWQAMHHLLLFAHRLKKKRGSKMRVLITMMKDKDISTVFKLFASDDLVNLTTLPYLRTAKEKDFPLSVRQHDPYWSDYRLAYRRLKQRSQKNDLLLVTGSFYLVGAILKMEERDAR